MQQIYLTVVEHCVTQQSFKHYVTYHFVSFIQTCGKRCWEKLYNVNQRCHDCWRTIVRILFTTVQFSLISVVHRWKYTCIWVTGSYSSTVVLSCSLVWIQPHMRWFFNIVVCVLFTTPAHGFICMKVMYTLSRKSLLYKVIRCIAVFKWIS